MIVIKFSNVLFFLCFFFHCLLISPIKCFPSLCCSIVNKALDKKAKKNEKKKKQESGEEPKDRYESLYEHHATKSMRAEALAKKVQSETDRECTFKPKKVSKTRKTSPKKEWEPKNRTDSPTKKKPTSSTKYEREEDMPAHERLFKKAKDAAAKRRFEDMSLVS